MKMLLHIAENERWLRALGNAKNALVDCENEGIELAALIVANAEAVLVARAPERGKEEEQAELLAQMEALSRKGVKIEFCRNALRKHEIDGSRLPSFIEVVPAGVTEIARRQDDAYAYIRV